MSSNWKQLIPNFKQYSYYAGITTAFAEVVAAGVKQLALSHPYTAEELVIMKEPTKLIAKEHGITMRVEGELLITPLFPANIAKDKFVIFLMQNDAVWDQYQALKNATMLPEQLAWEFGRLLSYDDASIQRMLNRSK
ncbi:MAG: hypothetical protein AAF490_29740 [Chloroflexota bacterium]